MRLRALAKINLGLDILRKREDGYHEVRMIMQTIQMYDVLEMKRVRKPGISLSVNYSYIPNDERNLVYKAAKLLMDEFQVKGGVDIHLEKFIPVAAGMAGGSSDAAAALVGINRLFKLGLSQKELMDRAVNIGADVPYCVMRGTALAEGIGEKLTRITQVPDCFVLIGKPGINVSTKAAYESLQLDKISSHPDIDGMIGDIERGDLLAMTQKMGNVFEPGIIEKYPVIGEIKALMESHGALKAMMSGSGPTVFGIFDDREKMEAAAEVLRESRLAKTVFNTLRQAILKGELKPGERLMEIALAERLGVSRTPIREAMRKLEQEGLVVMIPRRGAQVANITEKDLNDVLEVRIALENVAIEKACARMTEEEMRRLWLAAKEFEHTIAEGNLVKLAEADVAFHEVIYQASDNKRLIQVLNNMREQIYRYRVEYLKEGETRDVLVKEHEELTKAIRERDVERAKQLSFQHIENQRMAIMRSIEAEDAERERAEKEKSRGHR